jgi:hypothetical protein
MNKSFTSNHYIDLTNQFHRELQSDLALTFSQMYRNVRPGKMALRNVLNFATSFEIVHTISSGAQQVIVN